MTQAELGDACALTSVHVSRVLKILRDSRVCTFKDGEVSVQDSAALVLRGQFDPTYLYLEPSQALRPSKDPPHVRQSDPTL
jgi:hypothetical protein